MGDGREFIKEVSGESIRCLFPVILKHFGLYVETSASAISTWSYRQHTAQLLC